MTFDQTKRKASDAVNAAHSGTYYLPNKMIMPVWNQIYIQIDLQAKDQFYWGMRRYISERASDEL
jgi:hypothetical protein